MKIIMSQRKEELERALKAHRSTVTVEAEYGNSVIEGTILTMAHHGPRADNPAPCLAWHQAGEVSYPGLRGKTDITSVEVVGVSHIDLDTLGGIAAILGRSSKTRKNDLTASFWATAAEIDVRGVHHLQSILPGTVFSSIYEAPASCPLAYLLGIKEEVVDTLNAWYAWSAENRLGRSDEAVVDVTDYVMSALDIFDSLLFGKGVQLIKAGREWRAEQASLDAASYLETVGRVILRQTGGPFVNCFYRNSAAVVAFNERTRAVTLSLADPIHGVDVVAIAQSLWGPEAGGRAGIAGSPRGKEMCIEDARKAAEKLNESILATHCAACMK